MTHILRLRPGAARGALAGIALTVALVTASGSTLAADGDLVFARLSSIAGSDLWTSVASHGASVYVGGSRAVLRRYGRSGELVWSRTVSMKPGTDPEITAVAADESGVYAAGRYLVGGSAQGFLARYRPNGSLEWAERIDVGAHATPNAIDTFGPYVYVAGESTDRTGYALDAAFVREYTRDGVDVWTRRVRADSQGGYLVRVIPSGVAASADRVYLVGTAEVDPGVDGTSVMVFVRAYDQEGALGWTDVRPVSDRAYVVAIAADETGAYVVAQSEVLGDSFFEPYGSFLLKYEPDDAFAWRRRITARSTTAANAVALGPSGAWITGTASQRLTDQPGTSADPLGDVFLVRITRAGTPRLTYQYARPGRQFGFAIAAEDGAVHIAGYATRFGPHEARGEIDGLLLGAEAS